MAMRSFTLAAWLGVTLLSPASPAASCDIPNRVKASEFIKLANLPYTTSPNDQQTIDLYLPAHVVNPPIVIAIHGGAFKHGNKRGEREFAEVLAHFGIATAAVNYRLTKAPDNLFPTAISDVRCAASWLQANAASLGVDPTRFAVLGGSAGGNLASLLGLAADPNGAFDGTADCAVPTAPPAMLGVADYYGLNEFGKKSALNHFQTVVATEYLGIKPNRDKPLADEASPISFVAPGVPPFFVARGTRDEVMPEEQATDMVAALRRAGVSEQYWDIPGLGHAFKPFDVAKNPILERSACSLVAFYQGVFGIGPLSEAPLPAGKILH